MDGRVTAGYQSAKAKNNQQLPEHHPLAKQLGDVIQTALARNPLFVSFALPLRVFPPLFNRYDGGELSVEDTYGVHQVKLPAGHMVVYPSTSLHHVRPVTRGARISSCFWIQSMLRDDGQRALLFDLDLAIQKLARDLPDNPTANQTSVQLTGVYHNLVRQWAEL